MNRSKEELHAFAPRPIYSEIYPLDEFYLAHGQMVPVIGVVPPDKLPQPYRSLLHHKTDMTSTLEKFHGDTLHIEILERHVHDNEYFREVALVLDHSKKRVEFGAIKITLSLFPPEAQEEILREHVPLGRILGLFNIAFSSRPTAWLSVPADKVISEGLQLKGTNVLYGRRNSLLDSWDRPLAEIVEILPP